MLVTLELLRLGIQPDEQFGLSVPAEARLLQDAGEVRHELEMRLDDFATEPGRLRHQRIASEQDEHIEGKSDHLLWGSFFSLSLIYTQSILS